MNNINLHSKRLSLRLVNGSDLKTIHELHSLPETDKYNTLGIPKDIKETKKIVKSWILENKQIEIQNYTFAIELIEKKQFIGLIALKLGAKKQRRAEVWYKLHSDFWGKGYGTEAVNCVLNFGFDKLNLHRIEAGCAVDNVASIKVLEKVGMTKEGRKRQVLPLKSGWSDNFEYAILQSDKRNEIKEGG